MLRYVKRIISIASLLLLLGVGVGLVVLQLSGGKLMSVQSGSMEPNINKGGLVAVTHIPTESIKSGDIITYISPLEKGQTITHRVIGTRASVMSGGKPYFITKGDANQTEDQPVPTTAVIGKVNFDIPYAGYAIDFISKPLGLLLIIWLPTLWIVVSETKRLSAYFGKMQTYQYYRLRPEIIGPLKYKQRAQVRMAMLIAGMIMLGSVALTTPVFAAMQSSVTLTGNTISSAAAEQPPEPPEEEPGNTVTCTNNTNVSLHSTTNQSATSGSASNSNNTNGGSATSGNASNSSSTSIDVNVNNGSCVPAAQTP